LGAAALRVELDAAARRSCKPKWLASAERAAGDVTQITAGPAFFCQGFGARGGSKKIMQPASYKEGSMLKISFIIRAAFLGMVLVESVAALADPVSDADIRGKKICWTDGIISTYGKDGSFDSNRSGHGTWTLAGDRLTVIAANGAGESQITKENGTFHTLRTGRHGNNFEGWGRYCN
jgi:hypothetical protein